MPRPYKLRASFASRGSKRNRRGVILLSRRRLIHCRQNYEDACARGTREGERWRAYSTFRPIDEPAPATQARDVCAQAETLPKARDHLSKIQQSDASCNGIKATKNGD